MQRKRKILPIGAVLKDIFGGDLPTKDKVNKIFGVRREILPQYGSCNKENTIAIEVYAKINEALLKKKTPNKNEVCSVCPRWDCPVKKGTVDLEEVDNHK